jgi:hypothetical protein
MLLESKSVVVHFQGKAFNSTSLFVYQPADVGGGATDIKFKLGGVNHID